MKDLRVTGYQGTAFPIVCFHVSILRPRAGRFSRKSEDEVVSPQPLHPAWHNYDDF
jgi:hypothetical protein